MSSSSHLPHQRGTLITTDPPVKQLIMVINQENNDKIVLKDLDSTHLLIATEYVDYIKQEVERILESQTLWDPNLMNK